MVMQQKLFILIPFFLIIWSFNACKAGNQETDKVNSNVSQQLHDCPIHDDLTFYVTERDIFRFEYIAEKFNPDYTTHPDLPELIAEIGLTLQNTAYVAKTLEIKGNEQLVINLFELDCTTFVEYVLAMAFILNEGAISFWDFAQKLACMRYRNGIIDGYPSRLHYFSEWLLDNEKKGLIENLQLDGFSKPYPLNIHFMTRNAGLYPQLSDAGYVNEMVAVEAKLSQNQLHYIPKENIAKAEHLIRTGDIIAFTTNIEGLDVTHTGFAIHHEGRLYLLHASTRNNLVEISPVPLHDYLSGMGRVTGILLGRPREASR